MNRRGSPKSYSWDQTKLGYGANFITLQKSQVLWIASSQDPCASHLKLVFLPGSALWCSALTFWWSLASWMDPGLTKSHAAGWVYEVFSWKHSESRQNLPLVTQIEWGPGECWSCLLAFAPCYCVHPWCYFWHWSHLSGRSEPSLLSCLTWTEDQWLLVFSRSSVSG